MEKIYQIRAWDPDLDKYSYVNMTLDQIVENPCRLNGIDVAVVLINYLRKKKGMDLLPKQEQFYKVIAGEIN